MSEANRLRCRAASVLLDFGFHGSGFAPQSGYYAQREALVLQVAGLLNTGAARMSIGPPPPAPEGDLASCGPGLRRVLSEQPSEAVLALRRAILEQRREVTYG